MKGRAALALQPTGSMYVQRDVTLAERPNLSAVILSPDAPPYNLLATIPAALRRAEVVQRDGDGGAGGGGGGADEVAQSQVDEPVDAAAAHALVAVAASHAARRTGGTRKRKEADSCAGGAHKRLATMACLPPPVVQRKQLAPTACLLPRRGSVRQEASRASGFERGESVTYPGEQDGEARLFAATVLVAPDEYGRVQLLFDDGESGLYSSSQLQRV